VSSLRTRIIRLVLASLAAIMLPLAALGYLLTMEEIDELFEARLAQSARTISALVEAWVRKPIYADFMALRNDVATVRGWWRNRVARVLLNFFLTSLATAIGGWLGGARMLGNLLA
jgi:pheromone shutdown protein TraB